MPRLDLQHLRPFFREQATPGMLIFVVFGLAIALADMGIRLMLIVGVTDIPPRIVAGLTEPITSKLVPAVVVLAIAKINARTMDWFDTHPYLAGALGGLMFGLWERIGLIFVKGSTVTPVWIAPVIMHVTTGTLVAGTVFALHPQMKRPRYLPRLAVVLFIAMAIHTVYNGWVALALASGG